MTRTRRADDNGFLCTVALRTRELWDWVDRRQIDAYAISLAILWGTVKITDWAMLFVDKHPEIDGLKAAAIISAIMLPWSALQAAAIKFLFEARARSFYSPTGDYAERTTISKEVKTSA